MSLSKTAPICLTPEDLERLRTVVDRYVDGKQGSSAELLELELDRAKVLPQAQMPEDVVTMRSRVIFEDVDTGVRTEGALVYPEEADGGLGKISVLAPVGLALLGISRGACVQWPAPGGRTRNLRVVDILYQPEAAGDLHL